MTERTSAGVTLAARRRPAASKFPLATVAAAAASPVFATSPSHLGNTQGGGTAEQSRFTLQSHWDSVCCSQR